MKTFHTNFFTLFYVALLIVISGSLQHARAADPATEAAPVLVELFTSEGCSSCPPADAWLEQVDRTQPFPGMQLVVLSEHVDYWNHDGWKDPFSSSIFTERQTEYVHALGLNTAYTPQVIVNGTTELHVNDAQQVARAMQGIAASGVSVRISSIQFDGANPPTLRAHVDINGHLSQRKADVFVVLALDHAESQVTHGENGGRHLSHVAVAQQLTKIGRLEKEKNFSQDIQVRLKGSLDASKTRVIVFVQEPGPGKVLGAALGKTGK